jgi:hypothetical protein
LRRGEIRLADFLLGEIRSGGDASGAIHRSKHDCCNFQFLFQQNHGLRHTIGKA